MAFMDLAKSSVEPLSYIHHLTFSGANCQAKCNTFEK